MCNCEGPNAGEFADLVLTEEEKKEIAKVREIATGFPIDPKYISCKSIVSKDFKEIRVIFLDDEKEFSFMDLKAFIYISYKYVPYINTNLPGEPEQPKNYYQRYYTGGERAKDMIKYHEDLDIYYGVCRNYIKLMEDCLNKIFLRYSSERRFKFIYSNTRLENSIGNDGLYISPVEETIIDKTCDCCGMYLKDRR